MGHCLHPAGQESSTFTLVLEGNLDVAAGEDGFLCPRGPWSSFGQRILAMQVPSISFFVDLFCYLILFRWLTVLDEHGLIRVLVADLADDHFDPESCHAVLEYRFSEIRHARGSILDKDGFAASYSTH